MKHLFIARHGSCDERHRLDSIGHEQARELSLAIKDIIQENSFYLFCSTVPRAIEYAQDIATHFGFSSNPEQVRQFGWEENGNFHRGAYKEQREFLRGIEDRAEAVIVITHRPVAEDFLRFFTRLEWNQPEFFRLPAVFPGKSVYFDLDQRKYKTIP